MTDDKSETRRPRDELFAQFNQTIATVRSYSNHLETEIGRPAARIFFQIFEERPIFATFLATLIALSCFPVFAFVTASAVTIVSLTAFALLVSLSIALAVTTCLLLILISTLVASAFISVVFTAFCFDVYLAFRLFALVRQNGVAEGFLCWVGEIWKHVVTVIQHGQPSEDSDLDTKVEG